jgi:hypothetical protein
VARHRLTPGRFKRFVTRQFHLGSYLRHPGDGRRQPQIAASTLLWALLIGQVLREWSFAAIEALVRSPARRALALARGFSDDALGYFTERLRPEPTRRALAAVLKQAKRNRGFDDSRFLGLALDGTATSTCAAARCALCRPLVRQDRQVLGYRHELALISLVSDGVLSLPFDLEPYGPGESEYAAGQRLLKRAASALGPRFVDYVVVDGEYATAPFLHAVEELGRWVIARLKANLPLLQQAVEARFGGQPPTQILEENGERIELWDAADFDPWHTLRWTTVRVLRYRQHKRDGQVVTADWLTNAPPRVGSRALYRMAKSRWQVENQGFNDAKSHHGLEHLCHHHANSLLVGWLVMLLALCLERLYRLRYLHRGPHPVRSAIDLVRALRLSLAPRPTRPRLNNSS